MEQIKYANFWQRLGATIIDSIILFFIALIPVAWPNINDKLKDEKTAIIFILIMWLTVVLIPICLTGKTIGKKLFKLKIVDDSNKKPVWFKVILRETLGKILSIVVFSLGYISMWLDDQGRAWHDKLAKTSVISTSRFEHKRSVVWFYWIILLMLISQSYSLYSEIRKVLNRENTKIPCNFLELSDPIKTNHFDIYTENLGLREQLMQESGLFEKAFDYVFWSISKPEDKVTRSTICVYSDVELFKYVKLMGGVDTWGSAYFNSAENVINFGPDYWWQSRANLYSEVGLGTYIYHETAHYVIDNFLYQNMSQNYLDSWINEGLAQHFSTKCNTKDNRQLSLNNNISWEKMDNSYYTDDDFSIYDYYRQGCLMVEFMNDKYGNDFPKRIMENIVDNEMTSREAVGKITGGKNYFELNKEWLLWLK